MTTLRSVPRFPGYDDVELLGTERGAKLCRAHEVVTGRTVLVKVYRRHDLSTVTSIRFAQEVDTLCAVSRHPNIASVLGSGVTEIGEPFIVTEPVAGGTMSDRLNGSKLDLGTAVSAGLALCDALSAAHRSQVLHGAIDPDSVVFGPEGQVQLSDFTCFSLSAGAPGLSARGWQNMEYAAPEVRRGASMGPASDTYSLAATLITMITGDWLFSPGAREDPSALLARLLHQATATESPQLTRTLRRALDDDPTRRFTTAAELGAALALAPEARAKPAEVASAAAVTASRSISGRRRSKPVAIRRPVAPVVAGMAATETVTNRPQTRPGSRRRRRAVVVGLVGAALVTVGAGGVAIAAHSSGSKGSATAPSTPPIAADAVAAAPQPQVLPAVLRPNVSASCQGLTCTYSAESGGDHAEVHEVWTMADGSVVAGASTHVSYPRPGSYAVTVMTRSGSRHSAPVRAVVTLSAWPRSLRLLTHGSTDKHLTITIAAAHRECRAATTRIERLVDGRWVDSHRWTVGTRGRLTVAVPAAGVYRVVAVVNSVANGRCDRAASTSATIHEPVVTPPPAATTTVNPVTTPPTSSTPPAKTEPVVAPTPGFSPPP
jgi:Protein kinase domain